MLDAADQCSLLYERIGLMNGFTQYILQVLCTALFCALLGAFLPHQKPTEQLYKFFAGLVLLLTVLQPAAGFKGYFNEDFLGNWNYDAQRYAAEGSKLAHDQISSVITKQVRSYIEDKAASMDANLSVEIELSKDSIPSIKKVFLSGSISPYARQRMQIVMEEELGINREDQIWSK
jgi:hypothetical protein